MRKCLCATDFSAESQSMDKSKDSIKQLNLVGWLVFLGTLALSLLLYWVFVSYLPHTKGLIERTKEKKLNDLLLMFGMCIAWIVGFTAIQKLLASFGIPIFREQS